MTDQIIAIAADFSIEAAAAGAPEPKCPRFKMVANTGARMKINQWSDPLVIDLSGVQVPSQTLPVRMHHDPKCGIGHTTAVKAAAGALTAEGMISRGTPEAEECVKAAKNGFPWQASIGASPLNVEEVAAGATAQVNGRTETGPVSIVRACELREISLVDAGADSATSVDIAAKQQAPDGPAPQNKEAIMPDPKTPDLDAVKAEAGKAAMESLKALEAAFPKDPAFARAAWDKGLTVEAARSEYAPVLAKKLEEAEAKAADLEKQIEAAKTNTGPRPAPGAPPAKSGEAPGAAGGGDFMAAARDLRDEMKLSMREAMRRITAAQPELHLAFLAKAREHQVPLKEAVEA